MAREFLIITNSGSIYKLYLSGDDLLISNLVGHGGSKIQNAKVIGFGEGRYAQVDSSGGAPRPNLNHMKPGYSVFSQTTDGGSHRTSGIAEVYAKMD